MKGANSRHVKRWPSGHASACPGEAIIRLLRMFMAEHLCVTSISSTRPFHPFLGYLCCAGGCEESRHKISWLLLCTSATLPRSSSANRASPDVISAPLMGAMALAIKLSAAATPDNGKTQAILQFYEFVEALPFAAGRAESYYLVIGHQISYLR
jgi:hypothetical protein